MEFLLVQHYFNIKKRKPMKYIRNIYICKFQPCYDISENMYMCGETEMEYLGQSEST